MKINLISGESYLLINEKINEIVKDSKNVTIFDLSQNSIEDVILEAGYISMFLEEKFIIVKNANFFGSEKTKDSDIDLLLSYFDRPSEQTTIIFVCNSKIDSRKKITKIVKEKYNLITIPNLKFYEIENKVMESLKKKQFSIDLDTVKYIVANGQNNYDLIMMEVQKVLLYYENPGYISYEDVTNIISKSINTNNFLFVDAIVDNDLEKSLSLLSDLKIMKAEPTVLFSLLARDFRIMLQVKSMLDDGKREYVIMNEIGLQDWQFDKYLKKIFPYKIKELENILIKLANIDLNIKSGKIDKYIALELFIIDMCG